MQHLFVCKYDFDDPAYRDDWTTLDELLRRQGNNQISSDYLLLEREFLDVVARFLRTWDHLPLRYRFCYFVHPDVVDEHPPPHAVDLMLPLREARGLVPDRPFEHLDFIERLFVFQLAVRGLLCVAVEERESGIVLSTADEGFYWYLAIPDDADAERLVKSPRLYIYDTIDMFDPS